MTKAEVVPTKPKRLPEKKNCPVCGSPLRMLDVVLAECDPRHQCPECWSVIGTRVAENSPQGKANVPRVGCRRPRQRRAAA